jgi:SEC-C motif
MGTRVSGDLGQGKFRYMGCQPGKYPAQTLWRFEIYGGIDFAGSNMPGGSTSLTMAATGEREFIRNLFYGTQMTDREVRKRAGRNDPCPCGSGKKHKKCHGSVEKQEGRERMKRTAAMNRVMPSTYQPVAAHG